MNERSIFMEALDKDTEAQRSAYLDQTCGSDPVMRQRVEALLQSHGDAGSFLGKPAPQRLAEKITGPAESDATQGEMSEGDRGDEGLEILTPSDQPNSLGRLGHYEVLEVIGRGGMGIVLRAFDEKLHRVVAIKVMAAHLASNAAARTRFTREARAAAAVSHDHIVTIYAVEEANGLPYLVMQYVSGMSLQQRLDRDGPLELKEIVRIGMQTAAGLAAAHAHGLIHRDIKPANILLENGVERVKITDFGLARAVADASLTQSGVVAGTPQYMSPEQARGDAVDQRTDLFSLGSVLYAMCTGRPPFRADSGMAVLKRVCDDAPSAIRATNPEVPDWFVVLIAKLHAKVPADRFQSAGDFAELLKNHLSRLQHPSLSDCRLPSADLQSKDNVPSPSAVGRPQSAIRRRRWTLAAAALLLCLLGGLGITEATGVTNLGATVIRIFTPDGTLVVEVDDPGVKVTIEGDGGIVITGAGPQSVELRPGNYKVRATKDGKPVRDEELVTITRGGKQVVNVRREEALAGRPLSQEQKLEQARQQLEEADRLEKLGETLRGPDPWQAELHYRKAVAIYEKLGQDFPESPASKRKLEACRWGLSSALNMRAGNTVLKSPPATLEEWQRAVVMATEAVALSPAEKGFWVTLGFAQGRTGDWKAARETLEKAERVPMRSSQVFHEIRTQFPLAITYWQLGDKEKARERYQQAAELMEKYAKPTFEMRMLQAEAGKLLGIAPDPAFQTARAQIAQGDKHRGDKEYAKAIACYRAVLQSEPHNGVILNRLAWLLAIGPAEVRNGAEAVKLSQQACKLDRSKPWFVNTLGAAQYRAGEYAEALGLLQQVEKQFQDDDEGFAWPLNWFVQALCHAKLGQTKSARAAYEKSLQWLQQPDTTNGLHRQEALLLRDEVETLFAQLAELAGYDATLKDNPNDLATALKRGDVLRRLRRFDEAVAALSQVIVNSSDQAERHLALTYRAFTHAERGHLQGTIEDYEEAVRPGTDGAWIYGRLATCYTFGPEKLRNPKRALEHAATAIQKRGAHADYHTLHGVCLYRVGQHREAIEVLERTYDSTAKTKEGPTAMNRFFAALTYQSLGDPVKAKECYAFGLKLPQPTGHPGMIPNWIELMRAEAEAVLKMPAKK